MTNQEIIEWQRQYREWSLTRIGSVCERALRAAYNDGQDGNSDVCSINRAKASAHAAKVAAEELRALLCKQQSDLAAAQKRIAELEALLKECHTTMNHAEVFIATREKMHPTGQELYRELLEQIDKALTGETR